MSMISEQVKELRAYSNISLYAREDKARELLYQAADTIESLSAKLQTANMERSANLGNCGIGCLYWDSMHGGCTIHNTILGGCKDFCSVQKLNGSADCGGWIPCKERLPEIEQTVLLSLRSLDICVGFRANTEGYFYSDGEGYILYENVLAWRLPPNPYHEP